MQPDSFFHVALKVHDLEASTAFYREQLDGTVVDRGTTDDYAGAAAVDHVALEIAVKQVYLFDRAPDEAAGLVEDLPVGFLHFGYVVSDIEAAWAALPASVAEIMAPPTFGSLRIAFFADPDGVRIELLERLDTAA